LLVRYEDFVKNPWATVELIFDLIQEKSWQLPFGAEGTVELTRNHSVRGNPNRFIEGPVQLQLDEEWKEKMRHLDRNIVTGLTWPLLIKYHYLVGKLM